MKVYVKPEVETVMFATEVVTNIDTEKLSGYNPDNEV